jgi:hypothetical protein
VLLSNRGTGCVNGHQDCFLDEEQAEIVATVCCIPDTAGSSTQLDDQSATKQNSMT